MYGITNGAGTNLGFPFLPFCPLRWDLGGLLGISTNYLFRWIRANTVSGPHGSLCSTWDPHRLRNVIQDTILGTVCLRRGLRCSHHVYPTRDVWANPSQTQGRTETEGNR